MALRADAQRRDSGASPAREVVLDRTALEGWN
jgi:hypothetical protein